MGKDEWNKQNNNKLEHIFKMGIDESTFSIGEGL